MAPSQKRGDRDAREAPSGLPQERWPLVVVVVVGLVVGGVVLERLSRPPEQAEDEANPETREVVSAPPRSETVDLTAPRPTAQELTAEAKRLADQVEESYPEDPKALVVAGAIHYMVGQTAKGTGCWERCIKRAPQCAAAYVWLADAQVRQGEYVAAEGSLQRAAQIDPQFPGLDLVMAETAMNLGKLEEAISILTKANKAAPLHPRDRCVLGQAYLLQEHYEKAREQFELALAVEPRLSNAHFGLAKALRPAGRADEVKRHLDEYAMLKKRELDAVSHRRAIGMGSDRAETSLPPLVSNFYLRTAELSIGHGRFDDAEKQLHRAVFLFPPNTGSWQSLEAFYRQIGRYDAAAAVASQRESRGVRASQGGWSAK